MSIQYEVKDVFKIIIKKWYFILGICLFCSLIAIPISDQSYQKAKVTYMEKTSQNDEEELIDADVYLFIEGGDDTQGRQNLAEDIITLARKLNELGVNFTHYKSTNTIQISGENIKKNNFEDFLNSLEKEIDRILISELKVDVKIKFEDLSLNKKSENISELLLKEPTPKEIGIRVIGTAGIFGCLIGVLFVLIFDYIKCCKKIKSMEHITN